MPTWLPAAQPSCFLCCPVPSVIGEMESPPLRRASILREDNLPQMSTLPTGRTGKKDPTPSGAQKKDRRFPGTKKGTCVLGFKVLRGEVKTVACRQRWRERRKTRGSVHQSWAESKQKRKRQSQVPRTGRFVHLVGDDIRECGSRRMTRSQLALEVRPALSAGSGSQSPNRNTQKIQNALPLHCW